MNKQTTIQVLGESNKAGSLPILKGLLLDLDANIGIELEENNKICSWMNQVQDNTIKKFVKQDEGRSEAGSGRPALKRNTNTIGGNNSVVFHRQELVNDNESGFDHLTTGDGYTWFSVMRVYEQIPDLPGVNSFFGNLRNTNIDDKGKFEGFWGGLSDDNRPWMGTRNGITFGRWDKDNPMVISMESLKTDQFYIVSGRMGAGTQDVKLELGINAVIPVAEVMIRVNTEAIPSRMVIGQERDATNHPGKESFDGEISRFLIYERPLSDPEMKQILGYLKQKYDIS